MKKAWPSRELTLVGVVVNWSEEDESFIASSSLVEGIIGIGDTEQQAIESFQEHLQVQEQAIQEGKHAFYQK